MKQKSTPLSTFFKVRISGGLFGSLVGLSLLVPGILPKATAQLSSDSQPRQANCRAWLKQKVTASDGMTNSYFGSAAALNGSTAFIGAVGDNSFEGAAYLFTNSNGTWIEGQKLTAIGGQPGDEFGYRLALAENTLVVGAFDASVNGVTGQGAAYAFTQSNSAWSESQKLTASDGAYFDNFGAAVAISGGTIVVGADVAKIGSNNSQGAAYVFRRSNGVWTQVQKLIASDGAAYNNFGLSVAVIGPTILVGAPSATVNGNGFQGAAYVFTESNGTWSQTQKLTANDGALFDRFGQSVALSCDTALIGATFAAVNGHASQGAAYVFTNSNGTFTETQKLSGSDGESNDSFGNAMALVGNKALIGANGATIGQNNAQGKAYLFTETGGTWKQSAKLFARDGQLDDLFGAAVALDHGTALVSTPHPTINGNTWQGAAYFFENSHGSLP